MKKRLTQEEREKLVFEMLNTYYERSKDGPTSTLTIYKGGIITTDEGIEKNVQFTELIGLGNNYKTELFC